MGETVAIGVGIALMLIYLLLFAVLIVSYVLQSLSLHTLARRRGIANPWLAWLPYANYWIIGSLARDYDKQNSIKRRWDKTLLTLSIVFFASYFLIYIAIIVIAVMLAMQVDNGVIHSEDASVTIILTFFLLLMPIMIIATALQIITYICFFKIFESTVPDKALKYFLLSLLLPLAQPICLFLCRNKGYEHPDPMAYIYNPVNKNYSYYRPTVTESVPTDEVATNPQPDMQIEENQTEEQTDTEE